MKRKELTVTLTPEKALTKRFALKKSVCYNLVKLAKESKVTETTIYLVNENGFEWGNIDIHKGKDSYFNHSDFNLSFEYVTDEIDVATTYGIDIYKGKLDKEFAEYEVNRY